MLVRFTILDMDIYAQSIARWSEFYNLARSYNGIPQGSYWSEKQAIDFMEKELLHAVSDFDHPILPPGVEYVQMRGNLFSCTVIRHAYLVKVGMIGLNLALRDLAEAGGGSAAIKAVKLARGNLKALFASFEW